MHTLEQRILSVPDDVDILRVAMAVFCWDVAPFTSFLILHYIYPKWWLRALYTMEFCPEPTCQFSVIYARGRGSKGMHIRIYLHVILARS